MRCFFRILGFGALLVFAAVSTHAEEAAVAIPERVLGKPDAPIRVDEYVSLTCPHCAEFYNNTLPELEKRYVETGNVRFILHDFVMDRDSLKASSLARCMPEDEFYPFVKILFKNQMDWVLSADPEKMLLSYAKLGGLSEDRARACLKDTKMQDAIVADLKQASQKYNIESTPTFIINDGAEAIKGNQSAADFAKIFDRLLAAKR